MVVLYALSGVVLAMLFSRLSSLAEVTTAEDRASSMGIVERLSGLGPS